MDIRACLTCFTCEDHAYGASHLPNKEEKRFFTIPLAFRAMFPRFSLFLCKRTIILCEFVPSYYPLPFRMVFLCHLSSVRSYLLRVCAPIFFVLSHAFGCYSLPHESNEHEIIHPVTSQVTWQSRCSHTVRKQDSKQNFHCQHNGETD